jgi:halocyanin-like protein
VTRDRDARVRRPAGDPPDADSPGGRAPATGDRGGIDCSRRSALRLGAGAVGAAGGLAAATPASAQSGDLESWFGDGRGGSTANFSGTVDRTGQDEVVVEVGVDANGGSYGFGPAAVRVSPGTTVVFEWVSDTHNVVVESTPEGADWSGHEPVEDTGFSTSSTFETEGTYTYYCDPHLALGMKGAIVVGRAPVGEPDYEGWFGDGRGGSTASFSGTVDRRGESEVVVEVGADGNGGSYAYGPTAVRVDPGTTVVFEWVSDTHNVVVESTPEGADWSGHEPVEDAGFSTSSTFETEGVYTYYCDPHLSLGMKGAIVVGDVGGPVTAGGGEFSLSPGALLFGGVLATAAVSPLLFGGFMKYVYDPGETPVTDRGPVLTREAPTTEATAPLDHDEYDPTGTATLLFVYFLVLVGMWTFMYFVEFLGNGPTVVG